MATQVSSVLVTLIEHEQVSGTQVEYERFDFNLASDEAVEIIALDFIVQRIFPVGTGDGIYQANFSLNPNVENIAVATGEALNTPIDSESIWSPRILTDLITSGVADANSGDHRRDFPPGLVIAQSLSVGFNSNNTGGDMAARCFYRVLRLTDTEFVQLVARRRAR